MLVRNLSKHVGKWMIIINNLRGYVLNWQVGKARVTDNATEATVAEAQAQAALQLVQEGA